jgi:hypothetical protein
LTNEMAEAAINSLDLNTLNRVSTLDLLREFVQRHIDLARPEKRAFLQDFLSLKYRDFLEKYPAD